MCILRERERARGREREGETERKKERQRSVGSQEKDMCIQVNYEAKTRWKVLFIFGL